MKDDTIQQSTVGLNGGGFVVAIIISILAALGTSGNICRYNPAGACGMKLLMCRVMV